MRDLATGIASTFGLHDLPEHAVVDMTSTIVADRGADVFGNCVEVTDEIVGGFVGQFGMLLDGGIQIFYIGAVMHVMVQGHRLLVDGGFECVIGIRQRG